jgi:hypothetical protein
MRSRPLRHPNSRLIHCVAVGWLNERGESEGGLTRNEAGKLLVTTQPGEYLVSRGRRFRPVDSVRPYPFR